MNSLPTRVYKYEGLSLQTLRNLKRQSVYFGPPKNFNDPYDCAIAAKVKVPSEAEMEAITAAILSDPSFPEAQRRKLHDIPQEDRNHQLIRIAQSVVDEHRERFLATNGVACFSERNDNLLMWSHYGGHYRGFCLEFDTCFKPFDLLRKVRYTRTMPTVDMAEFMLRRNSKQLIDLFCTKSIDWKYEQEWRAMHAVGGTLFTYNSRALTGIYFGPDMEIQDRDMICLILSGQNPGVQFFMGRRSDSEFKVEFELFSYTSLAEAKMRGRA